MPIHCWLPPGHGLPQDVAGDAAVEPVVPRPDGRDGEEVRVPLARARPQQPHAAWGHVDMGPRKTDTVVNEKYGISKSEPGLGGIPALAAAQGAVWSQALNFTTLN